MIKNPVDCKLRVLGTAKERKKFQKSVKTKLEDFSFNSFMPINADLLWKLVNLGVASPVQESLLIKSGDYHYYEFTTEYVAPILGIRFLSQQPKFKNLVFEMTFDSQEFEGSFQYQNGVSLKEIITDKKTGAIKDQAVA